MVLFFFLGIVLFFLGVALDDHDPLKKWLVSIGMILWAVGANQPQ